MAKVGHTISIQISASSGRSRTAEQRCVIAKQMLSFSYSSNMCGPTQNQQVSEKQTIQKCSECLFNAETFLSAGNLLEHV